MTKEYKMDTAINEEDLNKVRQMIAAGADIDFAVECAVMRQQVEICQFLVENGADITTQTCRDLNRHVSYPNKRSEQIADLIEHVMLAQTVVALQRYLEETK